MAVSSVIFAQAGIREFKVSSDRLDTPLSRVRSLNYEISCRREVERFLVVIRNGIFDFVESYIFHMLATTQKLMRLRQVI